MGHRNLQSTLRYAEVDQATVKQDLEETLRAAISKLISYHRSLPLTVKFGDGTTSSSDGIRFGMAASSLHARRKLGESLAMFSQRFCHLSQSHSRTITVNVRLHSAGLRVI